MRYEIIQTQPHKDAAFVMQKSDGKNIGTAVRTPKRNKGFGLEFLDYHIRMKSMSLLWFRWKKALSFRGPLSNATYSICGFNRLHPI